MNDRRRLVDDATGRLAAAGVDSARYDAETLLAFVVAVPRGRLFTVVELTDAEQDHFGQLVSRRVAREPLQHLVGSTTFRHVDLAIGPGAFVPRPETEVVAGWAIEAARARGADVTVVDLGTGSGAIAAALANELPEARVSAVELDETAFGWAQRNLADSSVTLVLGDAATAFSELDGTVDVVVANPPYIPLDCYESVAAEARDHDPALALWSGVDGLDAIRVVESTAGRLLRPGGVVVCEHADVQGESAAAVFAASGRWCEVRDHRDLSERPRFVTAARIAG